MPAALDGAGGKLRGAWLSGWVCLFTPACKYSNWSETHGTSRLQRVQQKDVSTRAWCINLVLRFTSRQHHKTLVRPLLY